jgi:hypothetical protein
MEKWWRTGAAHALEEWRGSGTSNTLEVSNRKRN